jgi:tRNA A-37 threonylcarbamoyl transferase component Bud32
VSRSLLERIVRDPAGLVWQNVARPVKISRESLIVEADLSLGPTTIHVAYKQYRPRNWWKSLCGLVRRSRALENWEWAQVLLARGIATPPPVVACRPGGWRRNTSYLATQWLDGAENLHLYGWRLARHPLAARCRSASRCAESLGRLLGRLHAAGIAHRDLKAANLLVAEASAEVTSWLIDLDGMRIPRRLGMARRAADLARLAVGLQAHPWVSRAICCRFLRAYAAESPAGAVAWKPLWRLVAAQSASLLRRKRRRGQEVL